MVDLEIYYRIILNNSEKKESKNHEEKNKVCLDETIMENYEEKNIENNPSYFFKLREEPCELSRAKVEEFLMYDRLEKRYISSSIIKYKLKKNKEEVINDFKELESPFEYLEQNNSYQLYLQIKINENNYLKEKEKEKNEKKRKENEENKEIFSKVNLITKELTEIQKEIKNLNQNQNDEENENTDNYYKEIKKRKNSFHLKIKKNLIQEEYQSTDIENYKNPKYFTVIQSRKNIDFNEKTEKKKVYFLYSSPLQDTKQADFFEEDDSYYIQWLYIFSSFKQNNKRTELYLRQINENLYLSQNPVILHIRVDSILRKQSIYLKFCVENEKCYEYPFDNLIEKFNTIVNYKNYLKLIIISTDNIDIIKEKFSEIKQIKSINKIYIFHPNKYDNINNLEFDLKLDYGNKENEFIKNLYENLIYLSIKKAYDESVKLVGINDNLISGFFPKGNQKCFNNVEKNENEEENSNQKYILNYDLIKDNYIPIIGRKNEFARILLKKDEKMCVYGEIGVGKKCFIKKVGFSYIERDIVDKVYFLDIYPIDIKQSKKIYKIDMIIDEIYNNYDEAKILLTIYFNGIIKEENLTELKKEINKERIRRKSNVILRYLYVITIEKATINKYPINELLYSLELEHFNNCDKNGIKNLFNHFIKNKIINLKILDDIFECKNKDKNDNNRIDNIKITNIYLILVYIQLYYLEYISKENDKFKSEENIIQMQKVLFQDNFKEKKKIINMIVNKNEDNKEIFSYLYILKNGVGINYLKLIWNNSFEYRTKYIKNNLIGLIIEESNENEKIYRLDNFFIGIIGDILGAELLEKNKKKVLKYYSIIFRSVLSELEYDKILNFNASIQNSFWSNKKELEKQIFNYNENFIFNDEIDSNNIYDIIKSMKSEDDILSYLDDISITLPTLLHYHNNYIYEDLIVKLFEEKLEAQYKEYKKIYNKEKVKYIRKLIIRLGIFKCWTSKKIDFLNNSLEKVDIYKKSSINELTEETKIEYCLIKLYDHMKNGDKNIDELKEECISYIENISEENDKINFEIRCKALCAKCLNSIEEIDKLLKVHNDYEKEINLIKYQIIMYSAKNKFYFFLQNPLINALNKIVINNNFYLTQKLYTILPKNFQVEFKSFKEIEDEKESDNIKNIMFLFLGNKNLLQKYILNNNNKIHIKIMILGYFEANNKTEKLDKMHKKGIKNIIYISNYDENFINSFINEIPVLCIFEKLFFEFIHNFISILISKRNISTINKAFEEAKGNYNKSFRFLLQNYDVNLDIPNLEINMDDVDDTFEIEFDENEKNTTFNKENMNFIYDEYEDEEEKIKNIYYRKNPFKERKYAKQNLNKETNPKFIKLPGIDFFDEENLKQFMNGGIYEKSKFEELINLIDRKSKSNIFYIFGNLIFQIGNDLCKYFYMEKKYKNGIYIVKLINNKEELKNFFELNDINKNDSKLIVFDKIDNQNKIFDDEIIEKMTKVDNILFILCSENKDIVSDKIEYYELGCAIKDKNIIKVNKEYKIIQSIINITNI